MIGLKTQGPLAAATVSATVSKGFEVTAEGKKARIALIDEDGNVIEAGPAVAVELWNVCIQVQHNFWVGEGHITVLSEPAKQPAKKVA